MMRLTCYTLFFVLLSSPMFGQTSGREIIGVTEPVAEIDLAFPEPGIIAEVSVEEGDRVSENQLLARLDSRVQETRREIGVVRAESGAAIRSAKAELTLREDRLEKLKTLGLANSNPEEMARAEVDREMALAKLELAEEETARAKIELEMIEVEIDRRTLKSPIEGVVTEIYRDVAESVGGVETKVMTIVDLGALDLVVHVSADLAGSLEEGKGVLVERVAAGDSGDNGGSVEAIVEFVSPVVDASSGTRRVTLRLDNAEGRHESGVKYRVAIGKGS